MVISFSISTFNLTIKAENIKSKDNVLCEKNLFMKLLELLEIKEGFPSFILFLKIRETGLKPQLILFLSDVSSEIRGKICFQL